MLNQRFSDQELIQRLSEVPEVRDRLESLLLTVTDEQGELKEAESAELQVIEEMRQMGHLALNAWATRRVKQASEAQLKVPAVWQEGKKN